MNTDFKRRLMRRGLLALSAMGGRPMEREILVDSMSINWEERPARKDVEAVIADLEREDLIAGSTDSISGTVFGLTAMGRLKVAELR